MINAVALNDSALLETIEMLSTADGGVLIRPLLCGMLQAVADAEATAQLGAAAHERTAARTTQRNGTRDRPWRRLAEVTVLPRR